MYWSNRTALFALVVAAAVPAARLQADPCGMVPPVYIGEGQPIARVGLQQTYVFYKDGIETFVIRPGFTGKVDEFGMLIPFPTPPAVRKVPDHIFPHLAAAVDPPEVVVDLRAELRYLRQQSARLDDPQAQPAHGLAIHRDDVRVIRQEAVGMYEVAVLEAGSAAALKKWMDTNGYRYPDGMDKVCEDYVEERWCFVAVKTKVGQKEGVDPKPAQRKLDGKMPAGSTFDGFVQAMGFRFPSEELVVPMRLGAYNEGELRNVVYLLTDKPQKIRSIPEEYVVRQLSGEQLFRNVTEPLPLRIIGGTEADIPDGQRRTLPQQRDPTPHNGAAMDLFAGDLKAVATGSLSLEHEEKEKDLLAIGERLGLRGNEIDKLHAEALVEESRQAAAASLAAVKSMTLTLVDGDFPREVLARKNLTFAEYKMPARRNSAETYDAKLNAPAGKREGVLKLGAIDWQEADAERLAATGEEIESAKARTTRGLASGLALAGLAAAIVALILGRRRWSGPLMAIAVFLAMAPAAQADPCGMVPPIYTGEGQPIARVGEQMTYVFYKNGVETFVIRPGFEGKVDEFGMLIPFPTVPAIRKVPDHIFPHVQAAVDPPEVVVDLRPRPGPQFRNRSGFGGRAEQEKAKGLEFQDRVVVVKQEAIGMYEVAVLEAGSARALKRWMDDNGYKYPEGMDKPCDEYVADGWCFVAVKTKVGQKGGVDPKPAQREVNSKLPRGSTFDGHVQAMGFRFKSDELVVPMRLGAYNEGELHNIVYILTDKPQKIRSIPEEYVVRQISGKQLHRNVTGLLPLRIIGGTEKDLTEWHKRNLPAQRDPEPKNGAAKELFAGDLKAVATGELSLAHEEKEKELLAIGEALGLRGPQIDELHAQAVREIGQQAVEGALGTLQEMTLTVVDGDFPREVLAAKNLTFAEYKMPSRRNSPQVYDAKTQQPTENPGGILKLGAIDWSHLDVEQVAQGSPREGEAASGSAVWLLSGLALALLGLVILQGIRRRRAAAAVVWLAAVGLFFTAAGAASGQDAAAAETPTIRQLLNDLSHKEKAEAAVEQLVKRGAEAKEQLMGEAIEGNDLTRRGWAIVALGEIGGSDVDALLKKVHDDQKQPMLVRTWAAAARVSMVDTADQLTSLAPLAQQFPAVGRPIGMRLVEKLSEGEGASVEGLLSVSLRVPQLQASLAPAIIAAGADNLTAAMATAKDQNVRQQAAGYLATLAQQGAKDEVARAVVKQYAFDPTAKDVPWNGGPLFVPGIQWDKENAKALAGDLVRWHLWCDVRSQGAQQNQIHNNIRSLALANAAGYQSPGFSEANTVQWLAIWGKAYGKEELQTMLKEQGLDDNAKYAAVLRGL